MDKVITLKEKLKLALFFIYGEEGANELSEAILKKGTTENDMYDKIYKYLYEKRKPAYPSRFVVVKIENLLGAINIDGNLPARNIADEIMKQAKITAADCVKDLTTVIE